MSLVNIVDSDSVCESSDDMTAANTPAPSKPASTSGAWKLISRTITAFDSGTVRSGKVSLPSTPSSTLGIQTMAMHIG